ncbi:MAG: hypothetical protein P0120_02045 [Nitrospira sp.]|nr:hypothetical protein [Nitrospira sp.]
MKTLATLLFCLVAGHAMAEEGARSMVRAHLEPAGLVVVGQPVKLVVDVLVTTWFTSAPEFPIFDLPGALVIRSDEQAPHLTEQINGVTWFGLTQTYIVTPMEPHEFAIPRLQIVLHPGMAPGPVKVWSPARKFTARVPAGAEGVAVFLSTSRLDMVQRFDHKPIGLHVGDAFTRTITSTAKGTQAMFLPPIHFAEVEGLAVYPNAPKVENISRDREGFIGGRRIDSATYVVQKPGHYELPAVTVQWWDLRLGKLREHTVASVAFDAAPNPDSRPEIALPAEIDESALPRSRVEDMWRWAIGGVGALAGTIAIWLLWPKFRRYGNALASRRAEQRRRYEASEAVAFALLEAAVAHGDEVGTVQFLYEWLDRSRHGEPPARAEQAAILAQDDHYKEGTEALLARRFGSAQISTTNFSSESFARSLRWVRKQVISGGKATAERAPILAPLNPE